MPIIIASSVEGELPIVIDIGASCSITFILLDFIDTPSKYSTKLLGSLTQVKTKVNGKGLVTLDIEDMNSVTKVINTTVYYVLSATIQLFPAQVYIPKNPFSTLCLIHKGVYQLSFWLWTRLEFPSFCSTEHNFPIVLSFFT